MKSDLTFRLKVLDQGRLASHHQNLPNPANFTSFADRNTSLFSRP